VASDKLNAGKPAQGSGAFLLTWKESEWPHANILRMLKEFEKQGYVEEPWRIRAYQQAKPGDRVWVLKQGAGPKGISASVISLVRRGLAIQAVANNR
jgi:hypothetical protein